MDPIIIFRAGSIAKTIVAYLGLIDSVASDTKKLLHASFNSGIQNLEYARTSSDENQRQYIRTALNDFIASFSLEKDENLISAYVGASMCQHFLGDQENAKRTLNKIKNVGLSSQAISKCVAKDLVAPRVVVLPGETNPYSNPAILGDFMINGVSRLFGRRGPAEVKRINDFEHYKQITSNLKLEL